MIIFVDETIDLLTDTSVSQGDFVAEKNGAALGGDLQAVWVLTKKIYMHTTDALTTKTALTGLKATTKYRAYMMPVDKAGNAGAIIHAFKFLTPDRTAPQLTGISCTRKTKTEIDISVTASETGSLSVHVYKVSNTGAATFMVSVANMRVDATADSQTRVALADQNALGYTGKVTGYFDQVPQLQGGAYKGSLDALNPVPMTEEFHMFLGYRDDANNDSPVYKTVVVNADVTPPSVTGTVGVIGVDSAALTLTCNEDGRVYYAVLACPQCGAAGKPLWSAIKGGTTGAGPQSQGSAVVATGVAKAVSLAGLDEKTQYTVYFIGEDASSNTGQSVSSVDFTSDYNSKLTITSSSVGSITERGGKVSVTVSEAGRVHYMVIGTNDGYVPEPSAVADPSSVGAGGAGACGGVATAVSCGVISGLAPEVLKTGTLSGLIPTTPYIVYLVGQEGQTGTGKVQAATTNIAFTTVDFTPPTFVKAAVPAVSESDASVVAALNERGVVWYVVAEASANANPSSLDVQAGRADNGAGGATGVAVVSKGTIDMSSGLVGRDVSGTITGLTATHMYDVFLVGRDVHLNMMVKPTKVAFTAPDQTPPVFTATFPSVDGATATETGATARVQQNEAGRVFWVALYPDADAPSSVDVKAGTGKDGAASVSNSQAVIGVEAITLNLRNLPAVATCTLWFVGVDDAGNVMPNPTQIQLTTVDRTPPSIDSAMVDATFSEASDRILGSRRGEGPAGGN